MDDNFQILLRIHDVDLKIADITRRLASLDNGDTLRKQIAEAKRLLDSCDKSLSAIDAEVLDAELKLKTLEDKKKSFERKLYAGEVTNPKELSSMEKEVEILRQQRGQLDERLLELYETRDQRKSQLEKVKSVLNELSSRLEQVSADYETAAKKLNAELALLNVERGKCVSQITDQPLLQRYETLRARYKDTGLAKAVDGKCSACKVSLTSFIIRQLKDTGHATCESCARILVMAPETPPSPGSSD